MYKQFHLYIEIKKLLEVSLPGKSCLLFDGLPFKVKGVIKVESLAFKQIGDEIIEIIVKKKQKELGYDRNLRNIDIYRFYERKAEKDRY